jgi:hypothetical protein
MTPNIIHTMKQTVKAMVLLARTEYFWVLRDVAMTKCSSQDYRQNTYNPQGF